MAQPLATHLPPRDRRRGRRILTLRNFWKLLLVAILIFAALTLVSNRGGKTSPGEYGGLYRQQQPPPAKTEFHPAVITEAPGPVPEQERADPTLLDSAARSQYLGTEANKPPVAAGTGTSVTTSSGATSVDNASFGPTPGTTPLRPGQKVSIVGDSNGVTVVKH